MRPASLFAVVHHSLVRALIATAIVALSICVMVAMAIVQAA